METQANAQTQTTVKPHGCTCPLHPFQVISYVVFLLYGYVFYFVTLVVWSKSHALLYSFAIPYSLLYLAIGVVGFVATLSDPTDPTVAEERRKQANK